MKQNNLRAIKKEKNQNTDKQEVVSNKHSQSKGKKLNYWKVKDIKTAVKDCVLDLISISEHCEACGV